MKSGTKAVRDYFLNGGVKERKFVMGNPQQNDYQTYRIIDVIPDVYNLAINLVIKVDGEEGQHHHCRASFLSDLELINP